MKITHRKIIRRVALCRSYLLRLGLVCLGFTFVLWINTNIPNQSDLHTSSAQLPSRITVGNNRILKLPTDEQLELFERPESQRKFRKDNAISVDHFGQPLLPNFHSHSPIDEDPGR
ncbi:unnamed protein product [Schistosoma turkestanicum]|nr:unnamed protein product [Schistosoma turkestanicum]